MRKENNEMNWAIKLVEKHKPRDGDANIYGIILYTDAHPHIKKLLNDDDYWVALDEWSGSQWAVFSIRALKGEMGFPEMPRGVKGYMMPVWKEPRENKQLLDAFEIKSTESLPLLLIFAKDEDGSILKNEINIPSSSVEEAFNALKEELSNIAQAIGGIDSKNLKNPLGVHSAVSLAIQSKKDWKRLKKGVSLWQWLKSVI